MDQRVFRVGFAMAGVCLLTSMASSVLGGVNLNVSLTPYASGEYVIYGNPSIGDNGSLNVVWGDTGESRAVMEYAVPMLPRGSVISSASLVFHVNGLTTIHGSGPDLSFHTYRGDLVASSADAHVSLNYAGYTSNITTTGQKTVSLNLSALNGMLNDQPRGFGLMAYAESYGLPVSLGNSGSGSTSNKARLNLTVDIPRRGVLDIAPFVDVRAVRDSSSTNFVITDGTDTLLTQDAFTEVRRAVMEFDARGLPRNGLIVESAKLSLHTYVYTSSSVNGNPIVRPRLYYGQGSITGYHATIGAEASVTEITGLGPVDFDLDLDKVEELLLYQAPLLGVVIPEPANNQQFGFRSSEAKTLSANYPPRLAIAYALTAGATPGDADLDEDVDLEDAAILVAAFTGTLTVGQQGINWLDGDFDGDGDVDLDDAMSLRLNYNGPLAEIDAALASIVPEPASMSLLVLGGLSLIRRRRA